ncbi:TBC1 domain family member 25 [Caloenas nicobarica]
MAAAGGGVCAGGGAGLEEECEVVRVRVKKSEGPLPPEFRSFAVDPQITSLDVLQHILARAFDLQGKKSFSVSFATRDPQGQETFVPLLSDGDLAAAFTCARPTLRLRMDVRPPAESPLLEDWDIISPREVAAAEPLPERRSLLAAALPFTQALLAQVGRTLARAQAALSWPEGSPPSPPPPPCAPLSDADLRTYLGPGGRLLRPHDLRLHVYHGGVEPGLRKVVWRYLLNVFPAGLSGQERLSHLRLKAAEYAALKTALAARAAPAELALVAAAVRKDVVRTDRGHPYFGGPEDGHPHLAALQALLTTFALGHPRLSYCQGMSDVAAPLLAVLDDEAQAFLCFCALMRRLAPRFRPGGRGLSRAFAHLRRLLRRADPPFWAFLAARGAHDLLFCYRWLLLELKREFAFEDALRVLEVTWSSLPPAPPPPERGVPLLGAPLRTRRGLQERRGMRPRPPRRRRRQQEGEDLTKVASGRGGDIQEGPGSSSDVQSASKASMGVPEDPTSFGDNQEKPKSSSDIQGGSKSPTVFGDNQEKPKSSSNIQDGSKGSVNIPEVPTSCGDDQEKLKSSSGVQGASKASTDIPEGPTSFGDNQEKPKSLSTIREGPESSRDIPSGFTSSGGFSEKPKVFGDVQPCPGSPWNNQEDPEVSQDTSGSAEVPRGTRGDPEVSSSGGRDPGGSEDVRENPVVSKEIEPDPGGPEMVHGSASALEEMCEPSHVYSGFRGDPGVPKKAGREPNACSDPRDTCQGHSISTKGREGADALEKVGRDRGVSRRIGGNPQVSKEVREGPRETNKDSKEVTEVPKQVGEVPKVPREVDDTLKGFGHTPKGVSDTIKEIGDAIKEVGESFKRFGGTVEEVGDAHKGVGDVPQELGDTPISPREVGEDPREVGDVPKGVGDPPTSPRDAAEDPRQAGLQEGPDAPQDPWGGTWAWEDSSSSSSSCSSSSSEEELGLEDDGAPLPPPAELGQGNPFLLFLCLAMLLEQRDAVMARAGDYNEVAMHFDRLVRRHQLPRVLHRAKGLFARRWPQRWRSWWWRSRGASRGGPRGDPGAPAAAVLPVWCGTARGARTSSACTAWPPAACGGSRSCRGGWAMPAPPPSSTPSPATRAGQG